MTTTTAARAALAVVLLAVLALGGSRPARAQEYEAYDDPRWRPLFALNLDAGFAFDLSQHRLHNVAALGAGLTMYNGTELWTGTLDILGMRHERRVLGASVEYLRKVPVAAGATASALYDLDNRAPGFKAGVNINIIHFTGMFYFDDELVKQVFVFMRVPLGFIGYLWASER